MRVGVVHVAVVAADRGVHRHILRSGEAVVVRHGRIVHRVHRDGHGRIVAQRTRIADLVGEGDDAVVVRVRRVIEGSVRIEDQRAVRRRRSTAHQAPNQRCVRCFRIAVVTSDGLRGERSVLVQAVGIIVRDRRIVHRRNGDGHGRRIAVGGGIADLVSEAHRAREVSVGRIDERAVAIEGKRAVRHGRATADEAPGQLSARIVRVAIVAADRIIQVAVFRDAEAVIVRHGAIIHRVHRDGHGRWIARVARVAHLVGEADRAVVIRRGRVVEGAVRIEHQRAVRRRRATAHQAPGKLRVRVVDVAVVARDVLGRQGRVLIHGETVIVRDGAVVHRVHGDRDGRRVARGARVASLISEADRTVVVRRRCVVERAVRIEHQRAVRRSRATAHQAPVELRVRVVRVAVIASHALRRQAGVLVHAEGIITGHGRIVHAVHGDRHGRRIASGARVTHLVREARRAREVRGGRPGEGTVRVHRQRSVRRCGSTAEQAPGQLRVRVVHITVIACERLVRDGHILRGREGVIAGHRRIVHRVDRDGHGRRIARGARVTRLVGEAHRAVVVRIRRIGESASSRHAQHAVRARCPRVRNAPCELRVRVVHVAVVARHALRRQRAILVHREGVITGHRCIVARGDGDGHGRRVARRARVASLVGEAHHAVVVRRRHVGEGTGSRHAQHAVRARRSRVRDAPRELCVRVVHVAVIARHALCRQRAVLAHREAVITGDRCVVHRVDGDGHRGRIAHAARIADLVSEADDPVVVGRRREAERAVRVHREGAVRSRRAAADEAPRQRIAVRIAVVAGKVLVHQCDILVRAEPVIARDRRVVHAADVDRYRVRVVAQRGGVAEGVREADGAVEERVRRIGEGAVRVHRERAVRSRRTTARQRPDELCVRVVHIAVIAADGRVQGGTFEHREVVVAPDRRVVHRVDRDGHGRRVASRARVACLVGEAHRAVVVRRRRIGEGTRRRHAQCAVRACRARTGDAPGELRGGVVHITVVARHALRRQRAVLVHREAVVTGHRRIVARRDRDGHRSRVARRARVAGLVGEAHHAIVVRVRRVGECAASRHAQRAVRTGRARVRDAPRELCGRVVHVAIVPRHALCRQRAVLAHRVAVVVRDRCIVHGVHRDGHRCRIAGRARVTGLVGEADRAVVVRVRRVGERPGGRHAQRTVRAGRPGVGDAPRQLRGRVVHVAVVARHALCRDRTVLVHAVAVVVGHRCIVHRVHRDRYGVGVVAQRRGIAHAVSEGDGPVEVGVRRVIEGSVRVEHERSVGRRRAAAHQAPGELRVRVVDVGVIARHALTGQGHILVRTEPIVIRHRRIIQRRDGDRHRRRIAEPIVVAGLIGEADRAVVVSVRGIVERAVGIHRERSVGRRRAAAEQAPRDVREAVIDIAVVRLHVLVGQCAVLVHGERIVTGHRVGKHQDVLARRAAHRVAVVASGHGGPAYLIGGGRTRIAVRGRNDAAARVGQRARRIQPAYLRAVVVGARCLRGTDRNCDHDRDHAAVRDVEVTENGLRGGAEVGQRTRTRRAARVGWRGAHEGETRWKKVLDTHTSGIPGCRAIGQCERVGGVRSLRDTHGVLRRVGRLGDL